MWDRYEMAHSNYVYEAELSDSKARKLDQQHEENRRDFCRAQVTMRKYLTGENRLGTPMGTPREQLLIDDDEDLQRGREQIQQAERELERIEQRRLEMEKSFELQRADLEKMQDNLQRLSVEKSRRRATDPRREPLASRPGSKP